MSFFRNLIINLAEISRAGQAIAGQLKLNGDKQDKMIEIINSKITKLENVVWGTSGITAWSDVVSTNLVEDSRDEGVMIDRKKAVEIVTINGKAEKTITHTRKASLTKEEKAHLKEYGIVLIVK